MMGLMSVCVVKRWHLAQELMSFDHLGPVSIVGPLDHTASEPKKCACARTYTRKHPVSCVHVRLRLHLFLCHQRVFVLASCVDPQRGPQWRLSV